MKAIDTMSKRESPIILVANNPFGHHLLTSQLLNTYDGLGLDTDIILLCNGTMPDADWAAFPTVRVVSFASARGGAGGYLKLLGRLIEARWKYPRAVYHLRGFVAGAIFFLSRLFRLRSSRYIYDPRGAFFLEWQEAGGHRLMGQMMKRVEDRLIRSSVATVVTSNRFADLYSRLFGHDSKYHVIYNSTGFPLQQSRVSVPDCGVLRFVYLGTFNYWHDMDEIVRVMSDAAEQVGPERIEMSIYTLPKFHESVREKFRVVRCAKLDVRYVDYNEIPKALENKHVGVSVVRPTSSSAIASPIKIADYVALGLVPLMNAGIGDFDAHFVRNYSGILYEFGEKLELPDVRDVRADANEEIYYAVSSDRARMRLAQVVELLRHA